MDIPIALNTFLYLHCSFKLYLMVFSMASGAILALICGAAGTDVNTFIGQMGLPLYLNGFVMDFLF
jgi:hypothetical protein